MLRQDFNRIDPKRRNVIDHRKKQFADSQFKESTYPHRLNFYIDAPTSDITLEQFEQWAIDRLRVLAELEACAARNRSAAETAAHMKPVFDKYLPLSSNSSGSPQLGSQRQKDHYSHFILRLAFAQTEDLRHRFVRAETQLFRLRFGSDDSAERDAFLASLHIAWFERVPDEERAELLDELKAAAGTGEGGGGGGAAATTGANQDDSWFKVDWMKVPELVEGRKVFLRHGKAYVPRREQISMIVSEFAERLEKQLVLTSKALPRLDEDDRLKPVLEHLGKSFLMPDNAYSGGSVAGSGADISASTIDGLMAAQHFPACMSNLHRSLRRDAHLKHYGRLQYSLFLKGVGLSLDEALVFWRQSFHKMADDKFSKEYKYNIRHVYGDVGGDSNRRGGGYTPYGCQKILTEHPPGTGDAHGCPYRHFTMENLSVLLQGMGVTDRGVIQGVKDDKDATKYHIACNRVFEHIHKAEIKKAKEESIMTAADLDTIAHPNEYFKRSYLLKHMDDDKGEKADVKMEG